MKRVLAVVLLCGCGLAPKPETLVEKLRVLSITAEPPEVKPGESTQLDVLQLDPSRPGGKTTVLWVGCQPDPFGLGRSACNDTSALLQPTSFSTFPPGVSILGFGTKAGYAPAASLFDPVPAGDMVRFNGVVGQVLAVAIGEEINPTSTDAELKELFGRIERQEIKVVMALTRITVSEREPKNHNPRLDRFEIDGVALPPNATLQVEPGQSISMHVTASDKETYTLQFPEGPVERTENLVAAWYSTSGRFSQERLDLETGEDTAFLAPGSADVPEDPVPPKRTGTLWVVLRDGRGGQAYKSFPFFVCDDALSDPKPSKVTGPVNLGDPVVVDGVDMASALDVVLTTPTGPIALERGSYSPGRNAFLGGLPALGPGTYPVSLRTKKCTTLETTLALTVP